MLNRRIRAEMVTNLRRVFLSLSVIFLACVATNQQLAAQSIFESCAKDMKTYCSKVTPGNGRLSACIYAYEDKISDKCDAATENMSALLDWFLETVRYTYDRCADDIRKYCAGTKFGGGRILSCLAKENSQITDGCKKAISGYSDRLK